MKQSKRWTTVALVAWGAVSTLSPVLATHAAADAPIAAYFDSLQRVIRALDDAHRRALARSQQQASQWPEVAEGDDQAMRQAYRRDFALRQARYRDSARIYRQAAIDLASLTVPAQTANWHRLLQAAFQQHESYYSAIADRMDEVPDESRGYFTRETTAPEGQELTDALEYPLGALQRLADEHGIDVELTPAPVVVLAIPQAP